jgi:F-type H+-transporting ATPase subunit delta
MSAPSASSGAPAPAPDVAGTVFEDDQPEVSRSYAEALLGAAKHADQIESVLDELDELVADVLSPYPQFAAILASEALPAAEKDRILTSTLENRASPLVLRFLRVLNRHGRLGLIAPIARMARELMDRQQNRRRVLVRSAVPLTEDQRNALVERLGRMLAATPVPTYQIDPALIGGLVIQIGDDVYDASVRNRLGQLRNRLIEGKTHEIQSRRDQFSYSA